MKLTPDTLDGIRRVMIEAGVPVDDFMAALAKSEQVWTTKQLQEDFTVHAFLAPFVMVTRKSDGVKGSLEFIHDPRYYFGFTPIDEDGVTNPLADGGDAIHV